MVLMAYFSPNGTTILNGRECRAWCKYLLPLDLEVLVTWDKVYLVGGERMIGLKQRASLKVNSGGYT